MLKYFKIVTSVILVTASCFGAVAQTEKNKDVLLDGKPAKLNINTGILTFADGKVAKSKAAKTIKDSVKASNTVINKNPISSDLKLDSIYKGSELKFTQTRTISSNTTNLNLITLDTVSNSEQSKLTDNHAKIGSVTDMVYDVSQPITYENRSSNFHTVRKGESLYSISKLYKATLGDLKKANNLETTLIKIDQKLRVRNFDSTYKEQNSVWIVSKGDTLYSIAKRNHTTVTALKSLNSLVNNLIKIGQKLQLK